MLANLLPGVRELRVPFTTGAIYLLSLYILLFGILRLMHFELDMMVWIAPYVDTFGAPVLLSVLGFVAYLVGILMPQSSEGMRIKLYKAAYAGYILTFRLRFWKWRNLKESLLKEFRNPAHLSPLIQENLENYVTGYKRDKPDSRPLLIPGIEGLFADSLQPLRDKLLSAGQSIRGQQGEEINKLIHEGRIYAARVQVKNAGLYNAYDRSEAEASFRYGLIGPIVALFIGTGVLIWSYVHLITLLLLVPLLIIVAVLAIRGREKQVESNDAVILSILIGDIDPYEKTVKDQNTTGDEESD